MQEHNVTIYWCFPCWSLVTTVPRFGLGIKTCLNIMVEVYKDRNDMCCSHFGLQTFWSIIVYFVITNFHFKFMFPG